MGCASYRSVYEPTPSGSIEVKTIPESTVLYTEMPGNYFDNANSLFRRLFGYINENELKMTVPVESEFEGKAAMKFYADPDAVPADLKNSENVKILKMPEVRVASIGKRGSYSKANVEEARKELETWLQNNDKLVQNGAPYAVFWDSPFKLWFLKRYEVHIPIKDK